MNKHTQHKIIPTLRFPEFQDDGEWESSQLKNVCKMQAGKFVSASEINEQQNSELFPCYGGNGLRGYTKSFTHFGIYSLIGRQGALCGNITLATSKFHATEHAVVVTPDKGVDTIWLFHLLRYLNLNQYATGQAQPGLSVENLGKVKIFIPKFELEQQKIADCLSSLDELIQAQSQKLLALKTHKKGLMQQLFPAEGETVPKLRFPEFVDDGDWEEKVLGDIGDVFMCKRIFAEETNSTKGIPFFKIGTLGKEPDAFISEELFIEYKSKYNYPKKNEILITCSGTVGKCIVYNGEDAYFQDSNIVWISNPNLIIRNDLLFYMLSNVNWGQLNSTTIIRIYGSDLRNLSLKYPFNQLEQQKIAECLSSLDEQIEAQSQKIAALKLHKKGLMQQLFPSINETQ
ncbi:MAG: hypothetical protein RLZZ306_357 [Bacteroidota bacterium]|jgi:type I restriction enzyme S subunit